MIYEYLIKRVNGEYSTYITDWLIPETEYAKMGDFVILKLLRTF